MYRNNYKEIEKKIKNRIGSNDSYKCDINELCELLECEVHSVESRTRLKKAVRPSGTYEYEPVLIDNIHYDKGKYKIKDAMYYPLKTFYALCRPKLGG